MEPTTSAEPVQRVSVLMPIRNGEAFLDRAMESLARQETPFEWEFRALDSGSTDGTLAIFERWQRDFPVPLAVDHVHGSEFNHGCTRNLLAARSSGDVLVFVTDDAILAEPDALAGLIANYADPTVGAAYARNVPRPEADVLAQVFSAADPSYGTARRETRLPAPDVYARMTATELRLLYNFTDTTSSVRRNLWERHPYPRCRFGEDVLLCRALLEAGWTVVFDDRAVVHHSHEYDAAETRLRARDDAQFNAEWLDRVGVLSPQIAEELAVHQVERDHTALQRSGLAGNELELETERARELRRAYFLGCWEGGRSPRRRSRTALLDDPRLSIRIVGAASPLGRALGLFLHERGHRLVEHGVDVSAVLDPQVPSVALEAVATLGGASLVRLDGALLDRASADGRLTAELRRLDVAVAPTVALRDRAIALGFDPERAIHVPDPDLELEADDSRLGQPAPADGPRPRTADDWCGEIEFRLRQLACRRPAPRPGLVFEADPVIDADVAGPAWIESPGVLRLDPPDGRLVLAPGAAAGQAGELRLRVPTKAGEDALGAHVKIDGVQAATVGPVTHASDEPAAQSELSVAIEIPAGARELVIASDGERAMRLERVEVWDERERARTAGPGTLLVERWGSQVAETSGAVELGPDDVVRLGPERGRVEYAVEGLGAGWREIELTLPAGARPAPLRCLVDGRPVARLEPAADATGRSLRARFLVSAAASRLAIENRARRGGPPSELALQRVQLRAAIPKPEDVLAPLRRAAWALRGLADRPPTLEVGA